MGLVYVSISTKQLQFRAQNHTGGNQVTIEETRQAAEEGSVEAMNALGDYYFGQEQFDEAFLWFDRSAKTGDTYGIVMAAHVGRRRALRETFSDLK